MYGIVNKILGVVLCLILIVLMLANVMVASSLQSRRSIIAEVTNFVDEVTDTGTLSKKHEEDLYLAANAYGPVCDVTITRYRRIIEPDPAKPGQTYTTYAATENIYTWDQGDLVKVHVKEMGHTGVAYFVYNLLHLNLDPVDFQLTGRIR